MRIPADAVIAEEKLRFYLLVPRPYDDKSKFLARAGFGPENPKALESAIRELAAREDAVEDGSNEYGMFFRVEGPLTGPEGAAVRIAAIWLRWHIDGSYHFVTLKPTKEPRP